MMHTAGVIVGTIHIKALRSVVLSVKRDGFLDDHAEGALFSLKALVREFADIGFQVLGDGDREFAQQLALHYDSPFGVRAYIVIVLSYKLYLLYSIPHNIKFIY